MKLLILLFIFGMTQLVLGQRSNHLKNESSLYLQQHASNPVDWYPWGKEAFTKAEKENKLLIISCGYSSCHWCHVMEEETFSDPQVAEIMNQHFVCIKVDREERPDIDLIYLNAAKITSSNAGWPLNAFALPDGKPFYAATYFEKDKWVKLINYFIKLYKDQPEKVKEQAKKVSQGITEINAHVASFESEVLPIDTILSALENTRQYFDFSFGGLKGDTKFPLPVLWEAGLEISSIKEITWFEEQYELVLENISKGGIYDHLGGGFCRYSIDSEWKTPHFEKMLYDNAQLMKLYTHAFQKFRKEEYKDLVYKTFDFLKREMMSEDSIFFSSIDADQGGAEGAFYLWTEEEFDKLLGGYSLLMKDYYGFSAVSSVNAHVLNRFTESDVLMKKYAKDGPGFSRVIQEANQILLNERNERTKPNIDKKRIVAWNAMLISALTAAYRTFNDDQFLSVALTCAESLKRKAFHKGKMTRVIDEMGSQDNAFLEDYAAVISAWLDLYEATFDEKWLNAANELFERVEKEFSIEGSVYYSTGSQKTEQIIENVIELSDGVMPSPNGVMARNNFRLGHYFFDEEKLNKARIMVSSISEKMMKDPLRYMNWLSLATLIRIEPFEVAIVGEKAVEYRTELDKTYLPFVILYGSKGPSQLDLLEGKFIEDRTTIYVCRNRSCKQPVSTVEEGLNLIQP